LVTSPPRRTLNDAVTQFWSVAAPLYDLPVLQYWVYRPAQDEVIAALGEHGGRSVADIACGTGILAARISRELNPDQVYGVDMCNGMLARPGRAGSRCPYIGCPPIDSTLRTIRRPHRCARYSNAPASASAINIASAARCGRGCFRT
jgi:SAM-dependent methyltransferase